MKTARVLFLLSFGWVMSVHGQGASRLSTPSGSGDAKKQLQQAADRLREAQKNGELDRAKNTAKDLIKSLPPGVTDAARAAVQSPEARQQAIDAAKAAAGGNLPQGLSQVPGMISGQTPAAAVPADGAPAPAVAPMVQDQPPPAPSGPQPGALLPLGGAAPPAKGNPTAIIESDKVNFDNNTGIIIYTGHVRARHPDFYIECEELELHMIKEEEEAAKGKGKDKAKALPTPTKADPTGPKAKKGDKAPPIKKAFARGPMVIIEKRDPTGDVQQGRCKRLEYDGATGNITLSDFPQVQKGNILHSAITADTVMIFDREGRLSTNRPSRTTILSDEKPAGTTPPSN
ncbi:MAG: LptA/OstA family protein [Verrucomicrobiota bacterium]